MFFSIMFLLTEPPVTLTKAYCMLHKLLFKINKQFVSDFEMLLIEVVDAILLQLRQAVKKVRQKTDKHSSRETSGLSGKQN